MIGRTPGAVAYKLVNFVSLDPKQKLLGRKGAKNIGKLDKEVFQEFTENFDSMFFESEELLQSKIIKDKNPDELERLINISKNGENKVRETKVRTNQDYFRTIVVSNYANACGITGIAIPELLVASHIKPWSKDEKNRLNPANGICLSATFDKAFDRGFITIDEKFRIIFSRELKKFQKKAFFENEFARFENCKLSLPIKFLPSIEFLRYHNEVIFIN